MSDKLTSDVNGLEPGALVELFELDTSTGRPLVTSKTITGATKGDPVVITSVAHGFLNGDIITISGINGMVELNDKTYTVAVANTDNFQLSGINGLNYTTYSSPSGTATKPENLIFRWHSGKNENLHDIVWQGNIYSSFPIEATGFEWSGKGAIPRPTLTVANITSYLSGILGTYEDLIGSKVTRKRTFAKYLDAYCYVEGEALGGTCTSETGGEPYSSSKSDCENSTINGGAGTWVAYTSSTCTSDSGTWYANDEEDYTAEFADEIWYIDRKATETRTHVEFELTAAYDVAGIKLPARSVIANLCPWVYKGTECGYDTTVNSGGSCNNGTDTTLATCKTANATWTPNYFKIDNTSTSNASEDVCAKNFTACEKRFPPGTPMPFGGFPGATRL